MGMCEMCVSGGYVSRRCKLITVCVGGLPDREKRAGLIL